MIDRPISTSFNVYWSAWFTDEYDGAPDSHSLIGHGKTEAEAVADLLEQEGERDKGDSRMSDKPSSTSGSGPKTDTPRTDRLLATMEGEKQDIWKALKTITEWARGLERECASLDAHLSARSENALTVIKKLPRIVPSDLGPDEQWRLNGEYVSLFELRELFKNAAPQALQPAGTFHEWWKTAGFTQYPAVDGKTVAEAGWNAALKNAAPQVSPKTQVERSGAMSSPSAVAAPSPLSANAATWEALQDGAPRIGMETNLTRREAEEGGKHSFVVLYYDGEFYRYVVDVPPIQNRADRSTGEPYLKPPAKEK